MGGPEEAEGLSDGMTRSLFNLESLTVYFCLTCGKLATLSETNPEDHWEENQASGMNGKLGGEIDTDRERGRAHTPKIFRV